jgi:hypothetical protein
MATKTLQNFTKEVDAAYLGYRRVEDEYGTYAADAWLGRHADSMALVDPDLFLEIAFVPAVRRLINA